MTQLTKEASRSFSVPEAVQRLAPRGVPLLAAVLTDPAIRLFFRSKMFWAALVLKLALGSILASYYMRDLFVPFLNYFVESGFSNPWAHFAELGRLNSFPYPPIMLYILAVPRWLFGPFLTGGTDTVTMAHLLVMRLPLLACDIGIALILLRWFPYRVRHVLLFYWCSPFVIYISYWHGQLDIIPTVLFLCCLYLLRQKHGALAMAIFGLALATKSHLLVALPFVVVYMHQERGLVKTLRDVGAAVLVYLLSVLPFLPDPAFRQMVYGTQEQARLFAFQLPIGSTDLAILLAPGAIALLWFRFVAYTRRNWDLFMLYLGILFSVFILLAPPAPGYFLWSLPFLVHFMCRTGKTNVLPYLVYAAGYLAFFWLGKESDLLDAWRVISLQIAAWQTPYQFLSAWKPLGAVTIENLAFTTMQASLAGIVLGMYLFGVRSNAVYRMRTMPVLIGLAGDSGSGKDTFVKMASNVFAKDKMTVVAGDDYHRWPRGDEMWEVYTHLDVRGNDLYQQHEHAIALSGGKSIVKGTYDHKTGQFSEERVLDPGQYIIFSGLHSLSTEALRNLGDLKLFLDPDENLRHFWKVRRDCQERGYTPSAVLETIANREGDRHKYILPQREHADLVIRWLPKTTVDLERFAAEPDLVLEVLALNSFNFTLLVERLSALNTILAKHNPFIDTRWQSLRIDGTVPAEQLLAISCDLLPDLEEISLRPSFAADLQGCLQLISLVCLSAKLRWTDRFA